jgi:DNA-binding LytR/AlgR family response regulator
VNDKDSGSGLSYTVRVKLLLALLALLLLVAAAPPIESGPVLVCASETKGPCRPISLVELKLEGSETIIARTVRVRPDALPLSRPLMVWITAMASSEIRWNGTVVGRNGAPGADSASEIPGRFVGSIVVPAGLVRPGDNLVTARLSAHHLWLPVRRTVHAFYVTPYETPVLPGLNDYLPALLTLGALAAAAIHFGAAASGRRERRDRQAVLLASIAGLAMVQLGIEVLRVFVAYPYPWHLIRVAAIALLAAATSVLVAAWTAERFAPAWRRRVVAIMAAAVLASLLLVPWYDIKAMAAILAALIAVGACAVRGLLDRRPKAGVALAGAVLVLLLMAWQFTVFLDQAYYLSVAAMLVALVAEQVAILRQARRHGDSETERAADLEERLKRAVAAGETIVELKDGTRIRRVPESDIVRIRAADDYCDVFLADGRSVLVTATLSKLLSGLPERFVRVHKSHAVNVAHVASAAPRDGGGRALTMDDGATVPVGRSYDQSVAGWMKQDPRRPARK